MFSWELFCDRNALCISLFHVSLTLEAPEWLQNLAEGPRSHVGRPAHRSLAFEHTTLELDVPSYKKSSLCHLELYSAGSAHPSAAALGTAAGGKDEEGRDPGSFGARGSPGWSRAGTAKFNAGKELREESSCDTGGQEGTCGNMASGDRSSGLWAHWDPGQTPGPFGRAPVLLEWHWDPQEGTRALEKPP